MDIFKKLRELGFPKGEYVVVGSGPLAARGLREARDLDVAVTPKLRDQILALGTYRQEIRHRKLFLHLDGVEIITHLHWKDYPTIVERAIRGADLIRGFPFLSVVETIKFKSALGREKDFRDIDMLLASGAVPKGRVVTVRDKMQRDYRYFLTEPAGRNFAPDFRPDLTPRQMLELGVFGGKYLTDCRQEFPAAWYRRAKLSPAFHDPKLNLFGVNASQPLSVWRSKGWINETCDPRGWFQWYCRYYLGRRLPLEDRRQINRWKAMTRHIAQLKKACGGDRACRPRQRQALLHWAYDSRKF